MASIKFWGATEQVTGSMFELELDSGYRVLIDCGLSYEPGQELLDNARFPFNPEEMDLVLLTHAHTDHAGNLPTLVNQGFDGAIFCTEPTYDLCDILLTDSANIQAHKQKHKGRRLKGKRRLYNHTNVFQTLQHFITWPFDKQIEVNSELKVKFKEAGHILGAASIELEVETSHGTRRIGFSGDIGEVNSKLVVSPAGMTDLDYLVMESTYGSRMHREKRPAQEVLLEKIDQACNQTNGKLIIPAFSVGRTQAILFTLNQLKARDLLGKTPVFADGKLASFSSKIHQRYAAYLNEETQQHLNEHPELFRFDGVEVIRDKEDQHALQMETGASILVSSAGMLEGGMIRKHVLDHIENPNCTFLISGYCAPETLGGKLLNGDKQVWVRGNMRYVHAKIDSTDVFSAHTDQEGLLRFFQYAQEHGNLKKVFLVHGDSDGLSAFSMLLKSKGMDTVVPVQSQSFEIV